MHPEEPTGEIVNNSRISDNGHQDGARKIDASQQPAIPGYITEFGIVRGYSDFTPGGFPGPLFFYKDEPSTEVQDFRSQASKKHDGWHRPPICINPDAHESTSIQPLIL